MHESCELFNSSSQATKTILGKQVEGRAITSSTYIGGIAVEMVMVFNTHFGQWANGTVATQYLNLASGDIPWESAC